jgi:hypothetical protein
MDNSTAKRASIILGVVMIIALAASSLLPLLPTFNTTPNTTPTATSLPTATLPPVVTDLTGVAFTQDYLHPTGLYSIGIPTGWTPGPANNTPDVGVTLNNSALLSVIQTSLQVNPQPVTSLDELDARYDIPTLNQSWSRYSRWTGDILRQRGRIDTETSQNYLETARTRDDNNRLIIDFELLNSQQQVFLARQVSWYDQDWIYAVRVVVPENQIELLRYLMDNMISRFQPNRIFAGMPADWNAYFDPTTGYIIRYPTTWILTDSAPGRPASIESANGALRIQSQAVAAPVDEATAGGWVTGNIAGATLVSTNPVTRGDATGYSVAYTYTDSDGNPNSGLALLLNGANNTLQSANLRLFQPNVDLNTDTAQVANAEIMQMLGSFQQVTGLNVPLPTPTPTPTLPPPTPTALAVPTDFPVTVVEITADPTSEMTAEATLEATTVPASNTPEPTAVPATATTEPTVAPTSTPRPTRAPSNTPEPTVAPTNTVRPTNTPRPTQRPSATPSAEVTAEATASS